MAPGDCLHLAEYGHCLVGQGDDMRPACLHPFGGNGPHGSIKVELCPRRVAQLARANPRQQQQADGVASHQVGAGRVQAFQQLGQLSERDVRVVLHSRCMFG
ncbi:hypothetical protein D9M71_605690 [compost metagenome]